MQKQILISCFGGSHLYGLNTKDSDCDRRGVFVGQEPNIYRRGEVDSLYLRLDRALLSVQDSTVTAEIFYAPKSKINFVREDFYALAMGPMARNIIDSHALYESYEKYILKHIEIGAGLRLPKKKDAKNRLLFEKYGHVPKGFVHAIRASMQVHKWVDSGFEIFPVYLPDHFTDTQVSFLRDVKENPQNFSKDQLLQMSTTYYAGARDAFLKRKIDRTPKKEYIDFLLKMFGQENLLETEIDCPKNEV